MPDQVWHDVVLSETELLLIGEMTFMTVDEVGGRNVSLKWFFISMGIVALLGIVSGLWQWSARSGMSAEYKLLMKDTSHQSALTVGRSIAAFGNKQIVAGNWEQLQEYADELVRANTLDYVAIVNQKGVAAVHTNRSYKGIKFAEPEDTDLSVHASVPAMNLTRQVGTISVGERVPSK